MNASRAIATSKRDVWCFAVSSVVHVVILAWGALTFAAKPPASASKEAMPIDIISVSEFTQLTAGSRSAPKPVETAKPLVDKVGERNAVDDPAAKLEKKEVKAATDLPAPMPEPRPPAPAEKKQSEPKRDPIADAIKKDLAKKPEPKKADAKPKAKAPPKKEQPKFDPRKVEALLDKRTPQRVAATGDVVNQTLTVGARTGDAHTLSLSEIDAFRQKLKSCWAPPAGAPNADRISVPITIRLKPDRTLAAAPEVETRASDPYTRAMVESAVRAIIQCQPYTMFSLSRYEMWKELPLDFDPAEMFGG